MLSLHYSITKELTFEKLHTIRHRAQTPQLIVERFKHYALPHKVAEARDVGTVAHFHFDQGSLHTLDCFFKKKNIVLSEQYIAEARDVRTVVNFYIRYNSSILSTISCENIVFERTIVLIESYTDGHTFSRVSFVVMLKSKYSSEWIVMGLFCKRDL